MKIISITTNDGLPNEQIHAISEDEYGRLWLAGPAGAMCYNGKEVRSFDTRDGLECPGLRTIKVHKKEVWIGTDRGIERLSTRGSVRPINFNFEWQYGIAECFLFLENSLYVGTSNGLLELRLANEQYDLIQRYDIGLVTKILYHNNRVIAICSRSGLVQIVNNQIEAFGEFNESISPQELHLTIDKALLVGTSQGLFCLDVDGKIISQFEHDGSNNSVAAIESSGPTVYVSFGDRLFILHREVSGFQKVLEPIDFSSRIKDIHIDGYDNVWVGTNNSGLSKVSALNQVIYPLEGSVNNAAFCVSILSDKSILAGGAGFSMSLSIDSSRQTKIQDKFQFNSIVWDICQDPNDPQNYWIATEEGLYYQAGSKEPLLATEVNKVVRGPNRCLLARDNKVFVGTISGLYELESPHKCTEVFNKDHISFGYVYSLSLDSDDHVWVACLGQGLWKEQNNEFHPIIDDNISSKGNTYVVSTNSKGITLVIQQENIILIGPDSKSQIILREYPLGGWTGCWLDDTRIAVGSSDGICIIDTVKKEINHRINLFLDRTEWQFTSSRSLKFDPSQNMLYAGLNSGLFAVNLTKLKTYIIPPNVHLNQVQWKNSNVKGTNSRYYVEEGRWSGQAQVFSTWLVDESTIQYRFKIDGFDDQWTELSYQNTLHFNSLPVGEYEIQAQAFTPLSGFGEAKTISRVSVQKSQMASFKRAADFMKGFRGLSSSQKLKNQLLAQQNEVFQEEINERKKVERELKSYRAQLEELVNKRTQELFLEKERAVSADKLKTVFLATMSHEIRTPLGGIIGLNNLLKETEPSLLQEEYISKIDFSSQHLLQIINDILDITKIESGSLQLEEIEFSLHQLIEEVAELVHLKVGQNIFFIVDKQTDLKLLVFGDPLRIKQVIINLVGNAIKFTETGHIILKVEQLSQGKDLASIKFSVQDTGIGMSPKQQENLFMPFQQGDDSITRKYGGTGLGLNISEKFIHLMGSDIGVTSKEGVGSEFHFTLKLNLSEKTDSNVYKDQFNFNLASNRVLLLDNYTPSFGIINRHLKGYGFDVTKIDNVSDINSFENDLIVVNLTTLDDPSRALNDLKNDIIQKIRHKLLIIYHVGQSEKTNLKEITDHHLSVPVNQNKLVTSISKLLNNHPKTIEKKPDSPKSAPTNSVQNKRVLVAEDNQINQLIIKTMLSKYGFDVTIANNGRECVDVLKQDDQFELVFMDIQMPEMDGIKATELIRNELKNTDIPIVALTADVTVETKSKVIQYGMNDYLSKPLNPEDLVSVINTWIKLGDA